MRGIRIGIAAAAAAALLALALLAGLASPRAFAKAASPSGGAARAVYCGPAEKHRRHALLKAFEQSEQAAKQSFFATHPSPAARKAFDQLGNPTGDIRVPTITLHTRADPLVLVQNETVFADRVKQSRSRTADLVQLYTVAPRKYAAPAPYGAGHCNFTTAERVAALTLLDGWVRQGGYPAAGAIATAFAGDQGLDLAFRPGPWPAAGAG